MNGILNINKPAGWTSHDVVAKLRGILRIRKIGHSGTLDPMATGVLPVFVGRAARAVQFAESDEKEYIAGIRFGVETDTQDTTGTVLAESDNFPERAALTEALKRFTGEISQIPPMYSAVKIGGKRLYELARRGETAERQARKIMIGELELLSHSDGGRFAEIRVRCSKGTYIRTLIDDVGRFLGCGAAMSSLVRTRAGIFSIRNSVAIGDISSAVSDNSIAGLLMGVDSLFMDKPAVFIDAGEERICRNGGAVTAGGDVPAAGEIVRVYGANSDFLMLGRVKETGVRAIIETYKNFFEVG